MTENVRWRQTFVQFENAYNQLKEALEKKELTDLEKNGMVRRYGFTIELCLTLLKDCMDKVGVNYKPIPKETLREAAKAGFITNPQIFIDALTLRNDLSHDFSGKLLAKAEQQIRLEIFPAIDEVYRSFRDSLQMKP